MPWQHAAGAPTTPKPQPHSCIPKPEPIFRLDGDAVLSLFCREQVFQTFSGLLSRLEGAIVDDTDETVVCPEDVDSPHKWACLFLVLDCLVLVFGHGELIESSDGRTQLRRIVRQLTGVEASARSLEAFAALSARVRVFLSSCRSLEQCTQVVRVIEAVTVAGQGMITQVQELGALRCPPSLPPSLCLSPAARRQIISEEAMDDSEERARMIREADALGNDLSATAMQVLERSFPFNVDGKPQRSGGGRSTPPVTAVTSDPARRYSTKTLGYLVDVHLKYARDRLGRLEHWSRDVLPLLLETEDCAGPTERYPTLTKPNFVYYFTPFFQHLSLEWKDHEFEQLQGREARALLLVAKRMVCIFQLAMTLTKLACYQSNGVLLVAMKEGRKFIDGFLKAMPLLKALFPAHQRDVIELWQWLQIGTRQMQSLAAHGKTNRVPTLAREAPALRKALEGIIFQVFRRRTRTHLRRDRPRPSLRR
jgi:hypothetical protein